MSYVTYAQFQRDEDSLDLGAVGPALRAIGRGLTVMGGGVLFAATVYLMVVLPGLL